MFRPNDPIGLRGAGKSGPYEFGTAESFPFFPLLPILRTCTLRRCVGERVMRTAHDVTVFVLETRFGASSGGVHTNFHSECTPTSPQFTRAETEYGPFYNCRKRSSDSSYSYLKLHPRRQNRHELDKGQCRSVEIGSSWHVRRPRVFFSDTSICESHTRIPRNRTAEILRSFPKRIYTSRERWLTRVSSHMFSVPSLGRTNFRYTTHTRLVHDFRK